MREALADLIQTANSKSLTENLKRPRKWLVSTACFRQCPVKDYFYKGGELLAATKPGASGEYQYATADHLGSPRAWTDGSGNLIAGGRHDYSPFGEELTAGVGIRSADLGYGDDAIRQKFGTYERDNESGLDYAQARYFSSPQGRFTSPDPLLASGVEDEPQSWNRYAYCINNPLKFTDPTGMIWGFLQTNVGDHYVWYKDDKEREAAGATVVTANDVYGKAFIYQAAGGAWIRLDLSQNYWQSFEKDYQAYFGRASDGSSSLSDQGLTLNLFMAGQGGFSFTTNLARNAFLRASTIEVFRVEALAGANTRILIGEAGQVGVQGEKMLFLNFGVKSRAGDFLAKRLAQGFDDTVIKSFRVQKSFFQELRSTSVLESEAAAFPGRPLLLDVTKAANQFGLRSAQIQGLQKAIVQGTGKIKF